jgi:hypothetical protein
MSCLRRSWRAGSLDFVMLSCWFLAFNCHLLLLSFSHFHASRRTLCLFLPDMALLQGTCSCSAFHPCVMAFQPGVLCYTRSHTVSECPHHKVGHTCPSITLSYLLSPHF